MPPLYSSIALGATSATSTLMDKATQLITDIQSTLKRRNAVVLLTDRLGHQLERTRLKQPTVCHHCNQLILGLWPHAQQCRFCKLVSHEECSNLIDTKCTKGLNDPMTVHKFEPKTFLMPTMCDHCGKLICGLILQGQECTLCSKRIHHKCVDFFSRGCNRVNELSQNDINRSTSYSHQSRMRIEDFDLVRLLGTGSFSKVYLAKLHDTCEEFAIKVIKKTNRVVRSNPDCIMTEWKALNLGRNYRFLTIGHCCFQSQDRLYFVMEYVMGRDLVHHIRNGKFTEDRARFHSAEIALALMYLHSQRVIYRDLKLDNVILDRRGHCKLLDFGMSKILEENGQKTRTFCGTPHYISPEIIRGEEYDYSVDWWSLGVLMFEMIVGSTPFEAESYDELYVAIKQQEVHLPSFLSVRARSILDGLLTKAPQKRLGYDIMEGREEAIRRHPFFLFSTGPNTEAYQWEEIEAQNIKPPYIPTSADLLQVTCDLAGQDSVRLTPIDSAQLEEIRQTDFEEFSFYSESFKDFNC